MVNGKYNIKRLCLYEHKILALHNLDLKNSIIKNHSLLQQNGASILKKMPNLGISYQNISKNLSNVLWLHKSMYTGVQEHVIQVLLYQLLFTFLQRMSV